MIFALIRAWFTPSDDGADPPLPDFNDLPPAARHASTCCTITLDAYSAVFGRRFAEEHAIGAMDAAMRFLANGRSAA